jgi:hypothetical protein
MAKGKNGSKGSSSAPGTAGGSSNPGTSGYKQGQGAPPAAPTPAQGQAGRGKGHGAPNNNNPGKNHAQAQTPVFPEGSRLVPCADGSSIVIDHGGNIITTIPMQGSTPSAPDQFMDADGFRITASQLRKNKKAAARKTLEEEHSDFFANGGNIKQLNLVLSKVKTSSGQGQPRPRTNQTSAQGGRGTQGQGHPNNKRKKDMSTTPSGQTPPAKKTQQTVQQKTPLEGTFAAATKAHADRRRASQKESEQVHRPHALHIHIGKTTKGPMNKATYDQFRKELTARVLANAVSTKPYDLRAEFTLWSSKITAGVIACLDEPTATWYKETVDTIELDNGVSFRAWPAPGPQVGRCTFNAKGMNITPEQAVILIKAYNKELGNGVTTTRSEAFIARNSDPIIEIALSDDAAAILGTRDPKWKLNFGTDQRKVYYDGKIELAQRLQEGSHELYEQFRTTALTEERVHMETDEDQAAAERTSSTGLDSPVDHFSEADA